MYVVYKMYKQINSYAAVWLDSHFSICFFYTFVSVHEFIDLQTCPSDYQRHGDLMVHCKCACLLIGFWSEFKHWLGSLSCVLRKTFAYTLSVSNPAMHYHHIQGEVGILLEAMISSSCKGWPFGSVIVHLEYKILYNKVSLYTWLLFLHSGNLN